MRNTAPNWSGDRSLGGMMEKAFTEQKSHVLDVLYLIGSTNVLLQKGLQFIYTIKSAASLQVEAAVGT